MVSTFGVQGVKCKVCCSIIWILDFGFRVRSGLCLSQDEVWSFAYESVRHGNYPLVGGSTQRWNDMMLSMLFQGVHLHVTFRLWPRCVG